MLCKSTSFILFRGKIGLGSSLWGRERKSQNVTRGSQSHTNEVSPLSQGLKYHSACDMGQACMLLPNVKKCSAPNGHAFGTFQFT